MANVIVEAIVKKPFRTLSLKMFLPIKKTMVGRCKENQSKTKYNFTLKIIFSMMNISTGYKSHE